MNVPDSLHTGFNLTDDIKEIKLKVITAFNLLYSEMKDMIEYNDISLEESFVVVCNSGKFDQICILISGNINDSQHLSEEETEDLLFMQEVIYERYMMLKQYIEEKGMEEAEVNYMFLFQEEKDAMFDYSQCLENPFMRDINNYTPVNKLAELITKQLIDNFLN